MSDKRERRPVTDWLIRSPLHKVTKTKSNFWGGENYYVRLYDYFLVLSFLYESGAILGRAMRNKLNLFRKMLAISDYQEVNVYNPSMKDLQEGSEERLRRYRKRFGKEPDTFQEFIFERELQIATGLHPNDVLEASFRRNYEAVKAYNKKIPVEIRWDGACMPKKKEDEVEIRMFMLEGIGFGSYFPELTEKLNRNYWESVRPEMDRLSREFSKPLVPGAVPLDLLVKLTILSFEEQEEGTLQMVAFWAEHYYPELLSPLGLKRYCAKDPEWIPGFPPWDGYSHWFSLIRYIDYFS